MLQNYISGAINPDIQPRLPASPGVRQFTNIGEAFKTGFEIQWAQQLWEGISQQVSVAYNYGQDVEKDQPHRLPFSTSGLRGRSSAT